MAHIALTLYELETGGIARVAVYLANGFHDAGHRVTLVLCRDGGNFDAELRGLLDNGVEIVTLGRTRYPARIIGQIATCNALRRWIAAEQPDILLGTSNNISWFTGLATAFGPPAGTDAPRPRLYVKTTNPILRTHDNGLLTAIRHKGYNRLFSATDAVLTLSDAESRVLAGQFPQCRDRFQSVFNPYLTEEFLAAGAQEGPAMADGPTIVGVGRLVPQKNFARAIRAFAMMRDRAIAAGQGGWAKAKLAIAGEGALQSELAALVASLDLKDAVSLAGFEPDVPALLRGADLFLLSSEYEGLPAVVIEALGSACPVVATDCFPAAREVLGDLPGCRVTDLTADALANGMLDAAADTADANRLRDRAMAYSLPSAIRSHLSAMGL